VVRMPDYRLPKKLLYGELQVGKRSQGGQKKRYKDTLKASLKHFCIDSADWENVATNLSVWGCKTGRGAANLQNERIHDAIQMLSLCKLSHNTASFSSLCQKLCINVNNATGFSGLGLVSLAISKTTLK
jgi:hypothetical protein